MNELTLLHGSVAGAVEPKTGPLTRYPHSHLEYEQPGRCWEKGTGFSR